MPENSDGASLGIVAMLFAMFPEIQVMNSRQEDRGFSGIHVGLSEMRIDSHGESPIGLMIQKSIIQKEKTPDDAVAEIIAKMQDNQTMTTTAEVWQGGGPLVMEQDVIAAVIGRHIAVGVTEKPGDGHTGFAADEMPDKNTWERTLAATGNPEAGFAA